MLNNLRWGMGVGVVGFCRENGVGGFGFESSYDFLPSPTLLRSLNIPYLSAIIVPPTKGVYKFFPCNC